MLSDSEWLYNEIASKDFPPTPMLFQDFERSVFSVDGTGKLKTDSESNEVKLCREVLRDPISDLETDI